MTGRWTAGAATVFWGVAAVGVVAQAPPQTVESRVDRSALVAVEEIFRVGSVDGPAVQRFGLVSDVTVDPEAGEVFVLDHLERRVRVFDLSGSHLRSWGRGGEGPGELMEPAALAVARDTVIVADGMRLHVFQRDGSFIRSVSTTPETPVARPLAAHALNDGWAVTLAEVVRGVTGSVPFERTYSVSLETGLVRPWRFMVPRESLPTDDGSEDWWLTSPFAHDPVGRLSRDGVFWAAGSAEYRLELSEPEGFGSRALHFRYDTRRVEGGMRDAYRRSVGERCESTRCPGWRDQVDRQLALPHPSVFPPVGSILPGPSGTALVGRRDLDPDPFDEDETVEYDWVDVDGGYLGALTVPRRFQPMWLGEDRVFGVVRDGLDVDYVVGLALRGGRAPARDPGVRGMEP